MAKISDKLLPWVWAYREQLRVLDEMDAFYLDCTEGANGRCWNKITLERFLFDYKLTRGHHAAVRQNVLKVYRALQGALDNHEGETPDELNELWQEAVTAIGATILKTRSSNPPRLLSLASKLIWFHRPNSMTMYDDLAVRGLKAWMRSNGHRLNQEKYIVEFEAFFRGKQKHIGEASQYVDRIYPYPRRVADKWLWLQGNKKRDEILANFRSSLKRAPIRA